MSEIQPWGMTRITYRRVFWLLWRSNQETDYMGKWLVKLPFRFWIQVRRRPPFHERVTVVECKDLHD